MYVKARNTTRKADLGQRIRVAESFADRAIGLLRTPVLRAGEGLWLRPCSSIHTFFMRYPIDAAFLDARGRVLACQTLAPGRWSCRHAGCRSVLELPAGTLQKTGT